MKQIVLGIALIVAILTMLLWLVCGVRLCESVVLTFLTTTVAILIVTVSYLIAKAFLK